MRIDEPSTPAHPDTDAPAPGLRPSRSGLDRALAVVTLLADRSPESQGVSTIARELGLPKAVTHRILKQLTTNGFLRFDPSSKQYSLGAGALSIGLAAVRSMDAGGVAKRHMRGLVELTGETVTLSVRQGWSRVYIDQMLSPHEIRMSVSLGSRHALFAGSSSKAILAAMAQEEVEAYLADHELSRLTPSTITSAEDLRTDLREVQHRGFALSLGERQAGAASVAAPIRLASGEVFGSISICGPADRLPESRLFEFGALISRTAKEISSELGYQDRRDR